jgi:uncharacterized protein YfaP (DUF2135 family)
MAVNITLASMQWKVHIFNNYKRFYFMKNSKKNSMALVRSKKMSKKLTVMVSALLLPVLTLQASAVTAAEVVSFPGAEGYGRFAMGGRGGDVYYVTNLNDSGSGSLRNGIDSADKPRTIVFAVSGTIKLKSALQVRKDYITIAGQTAPGDGITLRDYKFSVAADHAIIRFIRSRLGDDSNETNDSMSVEEGSNVIFDHVTASWSVDEVFSFQGGDIDKLTVQWSLISESLTDSIHKKGRHGYGGIIGGLRQSVHHNLYAHHSSRTPKVSGRRHTETDFRNNVIYNWGFNNCYDGTASYMNWVNNYFKSGPATSDKVKGQIFKLSDDDIGDNNSSYKDSFSYETSLFAKGNYVHGYPKITADNWNGGINFTSDATESKNRNHEPYGHHNRPTGVDSAPTIHSEQTALEAYPSVVAHAGASLVRDSVDKRVAKEVLEGTYTYGNKGLIDHEEDVGNWPTLKSLSAPNDKDKDGMPDAWETAKGLNINDASDRNDHDLDADYTNLEVYLNGLVAHLFVLGKDTDGEGTDDVSTGNKIQAEDADVIDGVSIDTDKSGYTGNGFINFSSTGYIEFQNVDGGSGGNSTLTLRWALSKADRTGKLVINGVSQSLTMNSTGSNSTWATKDISVNLKAGTNNTIRISSTGNDFGNLDSITLNIPQEDDGGVDDVAIGNEIQAEDADYVNGVSIDTKHSGYTGNGFIDFHSTGHIELLNVDGGTGGNSTLTLRWALKNSDRTGKLFINGESQSLTMKSTGSWSNWATRDISVDLKAGTNNVIRFESMGGDFGNLDSIVLYVPQITENTYQAEDASLNANVEIKNKHNGYNGSGYVNFDESNGRIVFDGIDGGTGGNSTLTLRWALGNSDRTGKLFINGESQSLTMESTGSWSNWETKDISVDLKAGTNNAILFETTGSDFGNIDEIKITSP